MEVVKHSDKVLAFRLRPPTVALLALAAVFVLSLALFIATSFSLWVLVCGGLLLLFLVAGILIGFSGFGRFVFDRRSGQLTLTQYSLFRWGTDRYPLSAIDAVVLYKESDKLFALSLSTGEEEVLLQSGLDRDIATAAADEIAAFLDVRKSVSL
ncbi:MAG: hypothetical protein R3248_11690 [Candidatus Promineifilaceae bacterium]|nr:hypothetical protein [Candidatus Promineifilaceae bacterium]